jgi:16S rRNA processing protein RimM
MSELLVVGKVQRPHGLSGEVSIEILTAFPDRFSPGAQLVWRRGDLEKGLTVTGVRPHADRLLLTFSGVADVDAARELAGGDLCVPESEAFPVPEGYYYSHQIRGFTCEDRRGRLLGRAAGLEQAPGGPLLSVETPAGRTALVPFVHAIVVSVDSDARRIVLDPPEGLMEL